MGQSRALTTRAADKPVFFLLAGPNGAGKSTLYKAQVLAGTIPAAAEFVNADVHEAEQLLERVAQRVREGGHPLPRQRILERYPRTLANLAQAVRLADAAVLYDSTDSAADTQKAVALCKESWTQELVTPLPVWAEQVLGLAPRN